MQESLFFDIQKIHILIHKSEAGGFEYACPARRWDGFMALTDGACTFECENELKRTLKKGDILFLNRDEQYRLYSENGCEYYTSAFDFSEDSRSALSLLPKCLTLDALSFKELENATVMWENQSAESFMFCKIHLLRLYYNMIVKHTAGMLYSDDHYVNLAVQYIHRNFKNAFKAEDLAAYCSISESHLRMKFSKKMGLTIGEYRDILRVRAAKDLLASGLFTVKETAYELGFCDVYYFSKFFKRHVHVTPAKYIIQRQ